METDAEERTPLRMEETRRGGGEDSGGGDWTGKWSVSKYGW
jgi:hypothetical protein